MNLLFDTGILGQLCHPRKRKYQAVIDWAAELTTIRRHAFRVFLPEICDYELRRKLLHLIQKGQSTVKSIRRLDELAMLFEYLPLDTETMREAASLWAQARIQGVPTASDASLDADVILAAQALTIGGTVVSTNCKHLRRYTQAVE